MQGRLRYAQGLGLRSASSEEIVDGCLLLGIGLLSSLLLGCMLVAPLRWLLLLWELQLLLLLLLL